MAERLASAEEKPRSGPEEAESEREELDEDGGIVDLTESGEDEEEVLPLREEVGGACSSGNAQDSQTTSRLPKGDRLLPGTYEILLCVDFIETTG